MTDVQMGNAGNYAPERVTGGTLSEGQIASTKGLWGWSFFDWAAQPFFTVITTFIFVPYFTSTVIANGVEGQALWGWVSGAAGVMVAVLSLFLGPIADRKGRRKPWIFACALIGMIGCILLWYGTPNDVLQALPGNLKSLAIKNGMIENWRTGAVIMTMAGLFLATTAIETAGVFYNAMLPSLVKEEWYGRLSGYAWSLGYVGGMILLIISLPGFTDLLGAPLFPVDVNAGEGQRLLGPISGLWLLVFTLPLMLWTPDKASNNISIGESVNLGLKDIGSSFRELKEHPNILRFLIARLIYNDAVLAIIAFGGVYAAGTFGWGLMELGIFGIALNILAVPGSFMGGWFDDKFGAKRTIVVSVAAFAIATLGIVSLTKDKLFFFIPIAGPAYVQAADATLIADAQADLRETGLPEVAEKLDALLIGDENALALARDDMQQAVEAALAANLDNAAVTAALSKSMDALASMKAEKILTPQEKVFAVLAVLFGLCMGPIQASSRVMMARLAPKELTGAFFGLYQMSGKATAWTGPILIGIFTTAFDSQRFGMVPILIMLVVGLILFIPVRDERS